MCFVLRGMDTLSGEVTLSNCFASRMKRGLLLKEKICSLREQILSFKSRPLSEGFDLLENKLDITQVVSLVKIGR